MRLTVLILAIFALMAAADDWMPPTKEDFFKKWEKEKRNCILDIETQNLNSFNKSDNMPLNFLFNDEQKGFVLLNHNPRIDGFESKKSVGDGKTIVISARFKPDGSLCALYNKISYPKEEGDHRYIFFDDCSAEKPALKFVYRNVRKTNEIDAEAKLNSMGVFNSEDVMSDSIQLNQGLKDPEQNFIIFEGKQTYEVHYSIFINYGGGKQFEFLDKGIYRVRLIADRESRRVKRVMIEVPKGVVSAQITVSNDLGGLCGGLDRPRYVGFQDDTQNHLYISDQITDELMAEYWNRRNLAYLGLIPLPQLPEGTSNELPVENGNIECESRDSMAFFKSFNGVHLSKEPVSDGRTYVLFEYDSGDAQAVVAARYKKCGKGRELCHCGFSLKLRSNTNGVANYFYHDRCQSTDVSHSPSHSNKFVGKYLRKFLRTSTSDLEGELECKEGSQTKFESYLSCTKSGNLVHFTLNPSDKTIDVLLHLIESTGEIERIVIVLPRNDNSYKCQTRGICAQEVAEGCSRFPSIKYSRSPTPSSESATTAAPVGANRYTDPIKLDTKSFVKHWGFGDLTQELLVWDLFGPKETSQFVELDLEPSEQSVRTMNQINDVDEALKMTNVAREFIGQQILLYQSKHEDETVSVIGNFKRCQSVMFDNVDKNLVEPSVCLCGLYLKTVKAEKSTYAFLDYCRNLRTASEKDYELMVYNYNGNHKEIKCDRTNSWTSGASEKNSTLWAQVEATDGFKCARFKYAPNNIADELVIRTEFLKNNIKIVAEIAKHRTWPDGFLSDKLLSVKIYPSVLGQHDGLGAIEENELNADKIKKFRMKEIDPNFYNYFQLDNLYPLKPNTNVLNSNFCRIFGDPHIITFNKEIYSIQTTQDHYVLYELDGEIIVTGTFEPCNTNAADNNACMCSVYLTVNTRNPANQNDSRPRTVFIDLCGRNSDKDLRRPRWVERDPVSNYFLQFADLDCSEPYKAKYPTEERFWMRHPDFFIKCSNATVDQNLRSYYIRVVHETKPDLDTLLVIKVNVNKDVNPVFPLDFELYPSEQGKQRAQGLCKSESKLSVADLLASSDSRSGHVLPRSQDYCMCIEKALDFTSKSSISSEQASSQTRFCSSTDTLPMGVCVLSVIYGRNATHLRVTNFSRIDDEEAKQMCEKALSFLNSPNDPDDDYTHLLETCQTDLKLTGTSETSDQYEIAAAERSLKKDLENGDNYWPEGGVRPGILEKYNITCQAAELVIGDDGRTPEGGCSDHGTCKLNTDCTVENPCDNIVMCECDPKYDGNNCQDVRLFGIPIVLDRTCCDHAKEKCWVISGYATNPVEFPLPEDAPLYAQIIRYIDGSSGEKNEIILRASKEPGNRFFIKLPDTFEDFTAANFVMNVSLSMDKDPEKFGRYAQVTVFDSNCRSCSDGHIEQTLAPDTCMTSRGMCSTKYDVEVFDRCGDDDTSIVERCHEMTCSGQLKVAVVIQSSSALFGSETSRSRMLELLGEMLKTYYDHSSHMSLRFEVASATRNVRTYSSVQKRARLHELVRSTGFDHYSFLNSFMLKALENAADHLSPPDPDSYDAASHIPDTHVLIVVTDRFSNDSLLTEMAQIVNGLAANPVVNVAVLQIDDPQKEFELELDDATVRRFNFPSYASMSEALPLNRTLANDLCSTHTRFQLSQEVDVTFANLTVGEKFFEFAVENPSMCKTYYVEVKPGRSSLSVGVDKYPINIGEANFDSEVCLQPVFPDSTGHIYVSLITKQTLETLQLIVTCYEY